MHCNRCKSPMYAVDYGYQSNLESRPSIARINGYSCPICGNWLEKDLAPVMAFDPNMIAAPKPKVTPSEFIQMNFKRISGMRRDDLTWGEIKDKLAVNCSTHLIRNIFKKMLIAEVCR